MLKSDHKKHVEAGCKGAEACQKKTGYEFCGKKIIRESAA